MISLEELIKYERLTQGQQYPLYLKIRDDKGKIITTEFDGIKYEWIHKLIDIKEGKPIYTTGLLKEAKP